MSGSEVTLTLPLFDTRMHENLRPPDLVPTPSAILDGAATPSSTALEKVEA